MLSHFDRFLPDVPALLPLKAVLAFGWGGVDLFFALSGFLITGILMQTRAARNYFQSFYIRRFLRIFPIYYATLVAVFVVAWIFPSIPNVPPPGERWLYFAYLSNWISVWTNAQPPNVIGHFWSLAVEEQFYLVWPLCVLAISARGLLRTAIGLSAAALLLRCFWVAHSGAGPAVMLGTFTRMDSLLVGAIAAMMFARAGGAKPPRYLTAIGIVSMCAWIAGILISTWRATPEASFGFVSTIGYTLLAIACAALVLGAALGDGSGDPVQRIFGNAGLMRIGKYSYGMYVYHVPLLGVCELVIWRHLPASLTGNALFALAYVGFLAVATFGVAALSYEFVEGPILSLKRLAEPAIASEQTARA